MSYELSFSPEFFLAEGESYDRSDLALNDYGEPMSVYSALRVFKDENPTRWDSDGNYSIEVYDNG